MRGQLRDLLPENPVSLPRPDINWDRVRVNGILGTVVGLLALGVGGVLSGAGIFLLSMIAMDTTGVVASSFLLSVSATVVLVCYLWLTG